MKTIKNFTGTLTITTVKRSLYAMQVMMIALAIPILSYLELSHDNKPGIAIEKTYPIVITKNDAVAFNQISK